MNHKIKNVKLESIDPATKEQIAEYKTLSSTELKSKIQASSACWKDWKLQSFTKREELLEELSANLIKNKETLSEIITKEMGKPLKPIS